jgi:hypothetical protein
MSRRPSFLVCSLFACSLAPLACGGGGDDTKQAPPPAKQPESKVEPVPEPKPIEPTLPEDPFANDKWDDDEDTTGGEAPAPVVAETPTGPWPGPCKISYKGGPTLRFKYTEAGGTVRVDGDNDGTADTCSKFERAGDHVTKVSIDLGCDKKTDLRIEPTFEAGSNLGKAKVTASEENGGNREITLVGLGAFVGLEPGYPIAAKRADIDAQVVDGHVRKASTKGETSDDATALDITYDKDGRIKTIKEDLGKDGSVDRKFTYRFDAKGNLTRIDLAATPPAPAKASKQTATIDYSCWKK